MSLQIKKMHLSIIKGQNEQGKNIEFIYSRKLSGRYSLYYIVFFLIKRDIKLRPFT